MKTNLFNANMEYKAPECKTVEITTEGVLCGSGEGTQDFNVPNNSPNDHTGEWTWGNK